MRPFAAMGALKRITDPIDPPVKIASPVCAFNGSVPAPSVPTAQTIDSAPPPVVVAIGDPFPPTLAHQAVVIAGGDPAPMRKATNPLAPVGHERPLAGKARMVPEGVPITVGAVITTPLATRGAVRPPPTPPRLSRSARWSLPSFPR